ncbi:MAG: hypothetical protein ACRDSR_26245 [Pseudonocardiaceae bacterium]
MVVSAGRWVLFRFAVADTGMRRLAMVALTEAGHAVKSVAEVFGVHPNYLSTLRKAVREQGSNRLVKAMGRPVKLTSAQLAQAYRWAGQGVAGQEIARRLQVSDIMISRLVGGRRRPDPVQDELVVPEPADAPVEPVDTEHEDALALPVVGSARLGQGSVDSRYAGAMLLHAFLPGRGAGGVRFAGRRVPGILSIGAL